MTKEDFYNNEKFKATDFMEYKHDIWEFFRRYIYQIKEDKLNVTSIKVDRPLYEELKEMKKTFCMFVEHTEEPVSIFGMKLEIKDELEELKEHCDKLELINQKVMEENEQLKAQIEKMKCCHSCISHKLNDFKPCQTCDENYSKWGFAE